MLSAGQGVRCCSDGRRRRRGIETRQRVRGGKRRRGGEAIVAAQRFPEPGLVHGQVLPGTRPTATAEDAREDGPHDRDDHHDQEDLHLVLAAVAAALGRWYLLTTCP